MQRFHAMTLAPLLLFVALTNTALAVDEAIEWRPSPPRLSYIDGRVSYSRTGTEEWASASINLPLAESDALYTADEATLELQIGSRSFVRADENSELSLLNQDEHFIQFRVAGGLVSFDIRSITQGDIIEVDTPHAVFTIEHPGYFRVEVNAQTTRFITHRGGTATVTTPDGRSMSIQPSEDIVVSANNPERVATYAAPPPDEWDRWNDERSDRLTESISSRYVSPDVYGVEELDHYGHWRVVREYGPVWVPDNVGPDWVPYSTGSWAWDPYYEWTWIDTAPWGWAPFHYGRWVFVDSAWCWSPGPILRRPVYSPALVAFMIRNDDVYLRFSTGLPGLWWVALSWGEPVLPWWGPPRHRGHPHWHGWGGPRLAFDVKKHHYHNARFPRAVHHMPGDRFGRERFHSRADHRFRHEDFAPVVGNLPIRPSRSSLYGGASRGLQPPRDITNRPVVSTRPPRERALPWRQTTRTQSLARPQSRIVRPPARRDEQALPRPPFGRQVGPERPSLPSAPRFDESRFRTPPPPTPLTTRSQRTLRDQDTFRQPGTVRTLPPRGSAPPHRQIERPATRTAPPPAAAMPAPASPGMQMPPRRETRRMEREAGPPPEAMRQERGVRTLPGQPASRMYRGQGQRQHRWDRPRGR